MTAAAIIVVVLLLAIIAFQLALALGAPFGEAAWGGQHRGVLPTRLRIASGIAGTVLYPLIIVVVLSSAGVIEADRSPVQGRAAMWTLTALFAVGTLANFVSRSKMERYWGPVVAIIAVGCAIVASTS